MNSDRPPSPVERFVFLVDKNLAQRLKRDERPGKSLVSAARYTCMAPGAKRARPRLVFHFGEAVAASEDARLAIAECAELIHAASLVHDDVIDDGVMRRGQETVNVLFSNLTAVLAGDLMFSVAFGLLSPYRPDVMYTAVEVLGAMTRAAIDEVEARGDVDLSLEDWRAIAAGKTGALFGWCGAAPALAAGDDDAAARFRRAGEHLGVAFQLADDLKDLAPMGNKDRFADLLNKNPSYPILWSAARSPVFEAALRRRWSREVSPEHAAELGQAVLASGAADATSRALHDEVDAAFDALGDLKDAPGVAAVANWARALLAASTVHQEAA